MAYIAHKVKASLKEFRLLLNPPTGMTDFAPTLRGEESAILCREKDSRKPFSSPYMVKIYSAANKEKPNRKHLDNIMSQIGAMATFKDFL